MRNISFALTKEQFRDRSKTVTRRDGWAFLKPGDLLCGVEKSQGLGKGGKIKRMGVIRVVGVRAEPLGRMAMEPVYGFKETALEGYPIPHPKSDPFKFIQFFIETHKKIKSAADVVTRIEFEYVDDAPAAGRGGA